MRLTACCAPHLLQCTRCTVEAVQAASWSNHLHSHHAQLSCQQAALLGNRPAQHTAGTTNTRGWCGTVLYTRWVRTKLCSCSSKSDYVEWWGHCYQRCVTSCRIPSSIMLKSPVLSQSLQLLGQRSLLPGHCTSTAVSALTE
jgi:hypothetical protein